jgi:hypothetical protein
MKASIDGSGPLEKAVDVVNTSPCSSNQTIASPWCPPMPMADRAFNEIATVRPPRWCRISEIVGRIMRFALSPGPANFPYATSLVEGSSVQVSLIPVAREIHALLIMPC